MSYDVIKLCRKARIGNASQKHVLAYMAEKASRDGTGIWCSKGTIARETELAKSTVKKAIHRLLSDGIIVQTGWRECENGATVVYRIILEAVLLLHPKDRVQEFTSSPLLSDDRVVADPPMGLPDNPVPGSLPSPNSPKIPLEPPSGAIDLDSIFEKAWTAYPKARRRERAVCIAEFRRAVRNGASPEEILHAVIKYAQTTSNYSRCKVSFADNWFREKRWKPILRELRVESEARLVVVEDSLVRCKAWIENKDPMCVRISPFQTKALLDRKMVTVAELEDVGISVSEAIARQA